MVLRHLTGFLLTKAMSSINKRNNTRRFRAPFTFTNLVAAAGGTNTATLNTGFMLPSGATCLSISINIITPFIGGAIDNVTDTLQITNGGRIVLGVVTDVLGVTISVANGFAYTQANSLFTDHGAAWPIGIVATASITPLLQLVQGQAEVVIDYTL